MSRNKTSKFKDNAVRQNVIEPGKPEYEQIKGHWRTKQFHNDHPIVLELACGYGEYTVEMARLFPERNYIGVDIKGARIWRGSSIAIEENLSQVAFLRTRIQLLDQFFSRDEVDDIWIVFPDPRPRDRDERRRLTHPRFLQMYQEILKKDGWVRLKTDNDQFFEYTLEVINQLSSTCDLEYTFDLYHSPLYEEHFGIRTKYEKMFSLEGHQIKYLKFKFRH
ncbi:MAG: tRNA (guanosine(46)-N7)-methyltransferase TrmB [Candidatus Cyclobacteriaceae bacterium M3_2C_046]